MNVHSNPLCRSALIGVLALGALAAPTQAQIPTPTPDAAEPVAWTTDLEQALSTARIDQRLTLICFNMDGEDANERALLMYHSAEFRKATENVVLVLCSADVHSAADVPCERFQGCTCREHVACEKAVRRHLFGASRDSLAAQHLLLYPDGIVAWHAIYDVTSGDLFAAISAAEKAKAQTSEQRLRTQRIHLGQLSSKAGGVAGRGSPVAYMQIRAMLVQTPLLHFGEGLQALSKDVAERVLRDSDGHGRDQALALLEAAAKHSSKSVRELAVRLAGAVRARPPEAAPVAELTPMPAAPAGPLPLAAALPSLGPALDLARVQWAGPEHTLEQCCDHITVLWFFQPDAPGLASTVATMNAFAAANRSRGIETVGLVGATRITEVVGKLEALGCRFPVGVYVAAAGFRPCGVERFPSWVVLDPDTNVVFRTPQDGSTFAWDLGQSLVLRMAVTPSYMARIKAARVDHSP